MKLLSWVVIWGWVLAALFGMTGCAQESKSPTTSFASQDTRTPVTAAQRESTQGSQVTVYVVNAPGKDGLPSKKMLDTTTQPSDVASATEVANAAGGNNITNPKATYAQSGMTINITTGGTTPTQANTGTGTSTATQTPTTTETQKQSQKPTASVAFDLAAGLQASAQGSASAAGVGGSTTGTQSQTPTQKLGLTAQGALGLQASNQGTTPIDSSGVNPTATVTWTPANIQQLLDKLSAQDAAIAALKKATPPTAP